MTDAVGGSAPWLVRALPPIVRHMPVARYRVMNMVARLPVAPFWTRMPGDLGGASFRCDLRDGLMREVFLTGRYEPQETALMRRMLRPGMSFVDAGANWGYFSLVGAHLVGAEGRVLSIDADERACRANERNVERNGLRQVRVVNIAVSDGPGTLWLQGYEAAGSQSGNFGVAQTTTIAATAARVEMRTSALDDLLDEEGIERVDLLKMDVEGAEGRALPGLERRLAGGCVDRIMLELHPRHLEALGASADDVVSFVARHGFDAWVVDHSPAAHRVAASGDVDLARLVTPLAGTVAGEWPHILFVRKGLGHAPSPGHCGS